MDRWTALSFAGVIAFFVACSAAYAHYTPLGAHPDELSHMTYVQLLSNHFQLPVAAPEHQQPPLYYLVGAVLYHFWPSATSLRLLSMLFGALVAPLSMLAARSVWPHRKPMWILPALTVAAWPQLQFIASGISNDTLSYACAAFVTLLALTACSVGPSVRMSLLIGAGLSASLLAKETDYVLAAILVAVVIVTWWSRATALHWLIIIATPLLTAGWWFVRNLTVYGGPLPSLHPIFPPLPLLRLTDLPRLQVWAWLSFESMIGLFGSMTTLIANGQIIYPWALRVMVTLCVVALLAAILRWSEWSRISRMQAAILVATVVSAAFQMLLNSIFVDYEPQGRYMLVAVPALVLIYWFAASIVISRLPRRIVPLIVALIVASLAVTDAAGIRAVQAHLLGMLTAL